MEAKVLNPTTYTGHSKNHPIGRRRIPYNAPVWVMSNGTEWVVYFESDGKFNIHQYANKADYANERPHSLKRCSRESARESWAYFVSQGYNEQ